MSETGESPTPESSVRNSSKRSRLSRTSALHDVQGEAISSDSEEAQGEPPSATSRRTHVIPDSSEESEEDVSPVSTTNPASLRSPNSLQEVESESDDQSLTQHANDSDDEFAGLHAKSRLSSKLNERQREHVLSLRRAASLEKKLQANLERQERRAERAQERAETEDAKKRELIISVTVEWQGHHLPESVFDKFRSFCHRESSWFSLAYEKGPTLGLWHLQGVAVFHNVSVLAVKKQWIVFAGWNVVAPPHKVNNCFKEASGKGLSTQHGLLGYVRKDLGEYDGHLFYCSPSVTEQEKVRGDELYVAMGKSNKCAECVLTATNFVDRASLFFDRKIKNPALSDLDTTLKAMLETGKYSVHGSFFTNNGAMIYSRAQAAFHCRLYPSAATVEDVHRIFFNRSHKPDSTLSDPHVSVAPEPRAPVRDSPSAPDVFSNNDEYVHLDRSLHPDACSLSDLPGSPHPPEPLAAHHSTEVSSNFNSQQAPSVYDISQHYEMHSYCETAWDIAGDTSRRTPTRAQLSDPRFPPFFVQRTAGLNQRFTRDSLAPHIYNQQATATTEPEPEIGCNPCMPAECESV